MAFGPTNNVVASISRSRVLNVWDLNTAQELSPVRFAPALVRGVVSSSGRFIAGISLHMTVQRNVELYDLTTGRMKRILRTGGLPVALTISPDESTVACSYSDGRIRLWNVVADTFQGKECRLGTPADDLTFSPDGETLYVVCSDGNFCRLNPVDGSLLRKSPVSQVAVRCVVAARKGDVCVTGDDDGIVQVVDARDGTVLKTLRGHAARVDALTMSRDGRILCSGDWQGNIIVWDLKKGTQTHRLTTSASGQKVSGLTFLGDSQRFAASTWDGTVRIWDASSGREILADSAHIEAVRRFLSSSDDGTVLVSGDWSGDVRVWRTKWSPEEQQQMSANLRRSTSDEEAETTGQGVPQSAVTRVVSPAEEVVAADAARTARPLTNGNFRAGLTGWQVEDGAKEFRLFAQGLETALTTTGRHKDADTGRLYQCFQVPADAATHRLALHGGADSQTTYVALWHGPQLDRSMSGRNDITPFQVEWDVLSLRDKIVTLEIVDKSTAGWGFIGVQGISLISDKTPSPAVAPFDAVRANEHQEDWAKSLNVPVEYTNTIGMKFRLIPPGKFKMGSTTQQILTALKDAGDVKLRQDWIKSEGPQHSVVLTKPFYLGIHEVTQAQYAQIVGKNPSYFCSTGMGKDSVVDVDTSNFPVEEVDWNAIAEFCNKLSTQESLVPVMTDSRADTSAAIEATGYRLPTEAEWEFSCRAATTTTYWSGDNVEDLAKVGWFNGNSNGRIHPVGQLPANPFGLFGTHGNVWERSLDQWDSTLYRQFLLRQAFNPSLPSSAKTDSVGMSGSFDFAPFFSRSATRIPFAPNSKYRHNGFRVLLSVEAVQKSLKGSSNN